MENNYGFSIIICCYNSENRIGKTLLHLAQQRLRNPSNVEIILVNNNSSDQTINIAQTNWVNFGSPFELVIVNESKTGLTYARKKGVKTAHFNYIIFCDDDNWLDENYLETANTYFKLYPSVSIIGGTGEPVFEIDKPWWFDQFYHGFAIGKQAQTDGYVNTLYGAGMVLKKDTINQIFNSHLPLILHDRSGSKLTSGGDSEICSRTLLLGNQIFFTSKLKFKHFITKERLNWHFLIDLHSGFTHAFIPLHIYDLINQRSSIGYFYWLKKSLFYYLRVVKYSIIYFPKIIGKTEGNVEVIRLRSWIILGNEFIKFNFKIRKIFNELIQLKETSSLNSLVDDI